MRQRRKKPGASSTGKVAIGHSGWGEKLERAGGIEPLVISLEGCGSTIELCPRMPVRESGCHQAPRLVVRGGLCLLSASLWPCRPGYLQTREVAGCGPLDHWRPVRRNRQSPPVLALLHCPAGGTGISKFVSLSWLLVTANWLDTDPLKSALAKMADRCAAKLRKHARLPRRIVARAPPPDDRENENEKFHLLSHVFALCSLSAEPENHLPIVRRQSDLPATFTGWAGCC